MTMIGMLKWNSILTTWLTPLPIPKGGVINKTSRDEIKQYTNSFKSGKASGPAKFTNTALARLPNNVFGYLVRIINTILLLGYFSKT